MSEDRIESALKRAEEATTAGTGLRGTGFWVAVDLVRRDRSLAELYADRIAAIDRRAFDRGVRLKVRVEVGVLALVVVTLFGVGAILLARAAAAPLDQAHDNAYRGGWGFVPIAFLVGFGALIAGTHSLAHWVVGRLLGIRFTHVFIAGKPPEPGVKIDYATYLRASPTSRAVMHASGAVVTKIVPFALLSVTLGLYDRWPWLTWLLVAMGVVLIATDVLFSTKVSDWKKVFRELRAAQAS